MGSQGKGLGFSICSPQQGSRAGVTHPDLQQTAAAATAFLRLQDQLSAAITWAACRRSQLGSQWSFRSLCKAAYRSWLIRVASRSELSRLCSRLPSRACSVDRPRRPFSVSARSPARSSARRQGRELLAERGLGAVVEGSVAAAAARVVVLASALLYSQS